jgi:competence protein ComEC
MAGDLPTSEEDRLAREYGSALKSDILKASHHGSRHSTSAVLLAAVHPSIVVISAGKGNSYGHPAPEVLDRIRSQGARILSTVDSGTITFRSDGERVTEAER